MLETGETITVLHGNAESSQGTYSERLSQYVGQPGLWIVRQMNSRDLSISVWDPIASPDASHFSPEHKLSYADTLYESRMMPPRRREDVYRGLFRFNDMSGMARNVVVEARQAYRNREHDGLNPPRRQSTGEIKVTVRKAE